MAFASLDPTLYYIGDSLADVTRLSTMTMISAYEPIVSLN